MRYCIQKGVIVETKDENERKKIEAERNRGLTSSWSSLWSARFLGNAGTLLTVNPLRSFSSLRAPSAFRLSFRLARLKLIPCSLKFRCLLSTVLPRALASKLLYSSLRRMNFCSAAPSSLHDTSFEESESTSTDEFDTTLIVDILPSVNDDLESFNLLRSLSASRKCPCSDNLQAARAY